MNVLEFLVEKGANWDPVRRWWTLGDAGVSPRLKSALLDVGAYLHGGVFVLYEWCETRELDLPNVLPAGPSPAERLRLHRHHWLRRRSSGRGTTEWSTR